jgi:hypothetical protein
MTRHFTAGPKISINGSECFYNALAILSPYFGRASVIFIASRDDLIKTPHTKFPANAQMRMFHNKTLFISNP